jgi:alkylhydroperoxidase family enzyme
MARVAGVNPSEVDRYTKDILEAQESKWGAPLANHLVYARRPTIFRGARAMWTGLDSSALVDAQLRALINRRVAALNGCEF